MNKIMQLLCVGLIILLFVGISYEYIATKYDDLRYPPPGQFVQVNGRNIHYVSMGHNAPTIILDVGLGADLNWWNLVQSEVSKVARVVSFDRPGYGWSDSGISPRTSKQIVPELHELLQAAKLKSPYILVGHSFGGANMRLYANTYPEEVAGLILVDACHEDQNFEEDLSNKNILARCKNYLLNSTLSHYVGISRWFMAESFEPFFSSLMSRQLRDEIIAKASGVKSLRARDNEMLNLRESLLQLKCSKNALSDKPLIVITAEETNKDPEWQKYQKQLVSLSKRGRQIIAENSSHMINVDKPEVIVEAIKEIIELCK
jgi:pimeloyl-ACP methyl ester carboxylesterase